MSDYKQTRDAAAKVTAQYDKMLRNLGDDDLVKQLRDRIDVLEAKLARAAFALQLIEEFTSTHDQRAVAIEMLAELKGQNDE